MMRMTDRYLVEGTLPRIRIGHRTRIKKGQVYVYRTWTAQWSYEGKAYTESLKTTNKKVAIRRAHQIHERIHQGEIAPRICRITLVDLWERYMELRRGEDLSPGTIGQYELQKRHFLRWAEAVGLRSATSFHERDYYRYTAHLKEVGLAESTIYTHLILVKQVFKWAEREKLIPDNPVSRPKLRKPVFNKQPSHSSPQVVQILSVAKPHDACVYATLAYTGMRIGELCDLGWSDIDWDRGGSGVIEIRGGGSTGSTKNRQVRRVPINQKLLPYLKMLPRDGELVFTEPPRGSGGGSQQSAVIDQIRLQAVNTGVRSGEMLEGSDQPLNRNRLRNTIKRICKRLGFPDWKSTKLHSFRHTFASACAENNVPYRYALEWMGHHSSRILDLYIEVFDSKASESMQTLDYGDDPGLDV